ANSDDPPQRLTAFHGPATNEPCGVAFRSVLRSISRVGSTDDPSRDERHRSTVTESIDPAALRSGKGHRDENFPVASKLIHPRHRGIILAFYEFVRVADDIADHPALKEREKLDLLDRLEAGLTGQHDEIAAAVRLRTQLAERKLP